MAQNLNYPMPGAIYSYQRVVFDKDLSLAQNVILAQGREALSALVRRIDRLQEIIAAFNNEGGFYPHPEIPQILSELCHHQGVASSILLNDSGPRKDEGDVEYAMRLERYRYCKKFCDVPSVSTDLLRSRTIRNKLTHIDEYLFKMMKRPNVGLFIDSAIGERHRFDELPGGITGVEYCRTYVASEGSFCISALRFRFLV